MIRILIILLIIANCTLGKSQQVDTFSDSLYREAVNYFESKEYDIAIEKFTDVISSTLNDVNSFYSRGVCYYKLEKLSQACID